MGSKSSRKNGKHIEMTEEQCRLVTDGEFRRHIGRIAEQYARRTCDYRYYRDEFFAVAWAAACELAMRFDPGRGYGFTTFSTMYIRGVIDNYISKYVRQQHRVGDVRMSDGVVGDVSVSDVLVGDGVVGDVSVGDVRMSDVRMGDVSVGDGVVNDVSVGDLRMSDVSVGDVSVGGEDEMVDEADGMDELMEEIEGVMEGLTDEERRLIEMRFRLDGERGAFEKWAEEQGMSGRQAYRRAEEITRRIALGMGRNIN